MVGAESLSYFSRFDAESVYAEKGWLIGKGPVGGKAKGLAFAFFALQGSPLEQAVSLPPSTIVVGTEIFRDFVQETGGALHHVARPAVTRADQRVREIQLRARARDCHIHQPPFLLEPVLHLE